MSATINVKQSPVKTRAPSKIGKKSVPRSRPKKIPPSLPLCPVKSAMNLLRPLTTSGPLPFPLLMEEAKVKLHNMSWKGPKNLPAYDLKTDWVHDALEDWRAFLEGDKDMRPRWPRSCDGDPVRALARDCVSFLKQHLENRIDMKMNFALNALAEWTNQITFYGCADDFDERIMVFRLAFDDGHHVFVKATDVFVEPVGPWL